MKKKQFSEEKIIKILKLAESGEDLDELIRKYKFGKSTYYKWKAQYEGMSIEELKRLRKLEKENRRLKEMYATLSMDHEILKDVLEKKYGVGVNDVK